MDPGLPAWKDETVLLLIHFLHASAKYRSLLACAECRNCFAFSTFSSGTCKKVSIRSACAFRTSWPGPKLFFFFILHVYFRILSVVIHSGFYGSIITLNYLLLLCNMEKHFASFCRSVAQALSLSAIVQFHLVFQQRCAF